MNNAKAKFILRSYRSSGEDARDPAFREALEQAERDPGLKGWLQQEMELDSVIRVRLAGVPVPASLLDDIMASHSVTTSRSFWRRSRRWLALAAALVILLGGLWFAPLYYQPALSFSALPRVVAAAVTRPYRVDSMLANFDEARHWMQSIRVSADIPVSAPLMAMSENGMACRKLTWRGQTVVMLCFFLEDGRIAHYFILDRNALPDAGGNEPVQFARHWSWNTASWTDERHAYVLMLEGPQADLHALL